MMVKFAWAAALSTKPAQAFNPFKPNIKPGNTNFKGYLKARRNKLLQN